MATKKYLEQQKKRWEILDFATTHGYVINPDKGYDHYVEVTTKYNYCPCDPKRDHCPCTLAVIEVETMGHCLCKLFWKDYPSFKATLKGGIITTNEGHTQTETRQDA